MRKLLLSCLLLPASQLAYAQASAAETEAVKKTINTFFEGMRKGDSALVRSSLAPGVVLQAIDNRSGTVKVQTVPHRELLKMIGTPHPEVYDERISFEQVLIDANLASAWTPYQFYVGTKFSHCGYNSFQLVKHNEGWKIAHIIDTRRKEPCK
jgi:hypothetical protein